MQPAGEFNSKSKLQFVTVRELILALTKTLPYEAAQLI
jgi:hypothetical protein